MLAHAARVTGFLTPFLVLSACAGHTRMPTQEQHAIQESLRHRSHQLTVSMYVGPFFRDGRYYLLSDQPPGDVDLLRSPKQEKIHPGEPVGIIPAGTIVRIADVEFATASATTSRSLFTPRFFTWVLLELPGHDRPGVIVIRDEPRDHERFLEILTRYVTTEDVARELARYPEDVRNAVLQKRLVEGMDASAVRMSWGNALQVTRGERDGARLDEWRFEGGRRAWLLDGQLESFSSSGPESDSGE